MKLLREVIYKTAMATAGFVFFADISQAAPISINVDCAGKTVGVISADITAGKNISGGFDTMGNAGSLAAAGKACGEDHFNWYQIVVSDNGKAQDSKGNLLKAPYIDPPPGGYKGQWEDNLPWYLNEVKGPGQAATELSTQTTATKLSFSDSPSSAGDISFITWLVSVNADSSFQGWDGGFKWNYTTGKGVTSITKLDAGTNPTDAQYKNLLTGFDSKIVATPLPNPLILFGAGLSALLAFGNKREKIYS
jgi:hypothetical protein